MTALSGEQTFRGGGGGPRCGMCSPAGRPATRSGPHAKFFYLTQCVTPRVMLELRSEAQFLYV